MAWAREQIGVKLAELAAAPTAAGRAGKLGALAEHHSALARGHHPASAVGAAHRAGASVYRLLADAEFAAATGFGRHHTRTDLEPRVGDVLNRIATTANVATRPALLDQLQAGLAPGLAADAVAALPRTVPAGAVQRSARGLAARGDAQVPRPAAPGPPNSGPDRRGPPPAGHAFRPLSVHAAPPGPAPSTAVQQPTAPQPRPPAGPGR
jgi:hypothetical protein